MILCLSIIAIFISFAEKEKKTNKRKKIEKEKKEEKNHVAKIKKKKHERKKNDLVIGTGYVHSLFSFFVNSFPT